MHLPHSQVIRRMGEESKRMCKRALINCKVTQRHFPWWGMWYSLETPFPKDLENGTESHFFLVILIISCLEAEIWTIFLPEALPLSESVTGKHREGSSLATQPCFPPSVIINRAQIVQPSACRCSRLHPTSNRAEGFSKIMNFLEAKFLSIPQDYFMFPSNEILKSRVYESLNLAF